MFPHKQPLYENSRVWDIINGALATLMHHDIVLQLFSFLFLLSINLSLRILCGVLSTTTVTQRGLDMHQGSPSGLTPGGLRLHTLQTLKLFFEFFFFCLGFYWSDSMYISIT